MTNGPGQGIFNAFKTIFILEGFFRLKRIEEMSLNRAYATIISLLMIGSILLGAGIGHAITPQMGAVSYTAYYTSSGKEVAPLSSNASVNFTTLAGQTVASLQGPVNKTELDYGNYTVTVPSGLVYVNGQPAVSLGLSELVTVDKPSQSITLSVPIESLVPGTLYVSGLVAGSNATIALETENGLEYYTSTVTANSTGVASLTYYMPSTPFLVSVKQAGNTYLVATELTSGVARITVQPSSTISGIVESVSGAPVKPVYVVAYNSTSSTYSIEKFTTSSFEISLNDYSAYRLFIYSPGYNTSTISQIVPGTVYTVPLSPAQSYIYYNFSLNSTLQGLNISIHYSLGNYTTLPFLANSSVGSLYWQFRLDGITSSSAPQIEQYLLSELGRYTNYTMFVNSNNYNLTSERVVSISIGTSSFSATVNYSYSNTMISPSQNVSISLFTRGTRFTPGSLTYMYSVAYSLQGVALVKSNVSTYTFVSPIEVAPQSTSHWVSLTLGPAKKPIFIDPKISLYWPNQVSTDYILNSTYNNTVFIVPSGISVHYNLSKAFYNPTTASYDISSSKNITWMVNGTVVPQDYGMYNASLTLRGKNMITVKVESASGVYNETNFTVYAYNGTPTVRVSVVVDGKTVTPTSGVYYVPQNTLISMSAYNSSEAVPGTSYMVPLVYSWSLPSFTSTSENITYSFSSPYIKVGLQYGYINVTNIAGVMAHMKLTFHVNDTTPPSAAITLYNATGVVETEPVAGQNTTLSANSTTDPYYPFSQLTFNWTFEYSNGTVAKPGNDSYQIVAGSNTSSWIKVRFLTVDNMIVSLKVTNPSGVSGYDNKTLTMVIDTARIVINGFTVPKPLVQGERATIYVNVSNNGTLEAYNYTITLYVNGVPVATEEYHDLLPGHSANISFTWTPSASGNLPLEFKGSTSSEPAFFANVGAYTKTVSIAPPAYRTPAIIAGVIVVVIVVGYVYYRISSRPREPQRPANKQQEQKKPEQKKK